jgi:hypothetical protein
LAYSAAGFGAPSNAVPLLARREVQLVELSSSGATVDFTLQVTSGSISATTPHIAHDASAAAVQTALQSLTTVGVVDVTKVDCSTSFDTSGVHSTYAVCQRWFVTFSDVGDDVGLMVIAKASSALTVTVSVTDVHHGSNSLGMMPRIVAPTGPTNVALTIVSNSALGVAFHHQHSTVAQQLTSTSLSGTPNMISSALTKQHSHMFTTHRCVRDHL